MYRDGFGSRQAPLKESAALVRGGQAATSAVIPRSLHETSPTSAPLQSETNSSIRPENKIHYCMIFRCAASRTRRTTALTRPIPLNPRGRRSVAPPSPENVLPCPRPARRPRPIPPPTRTRPGQKKRRCVSPAPLRDPVRLSDAALHRRPDADEDAFTAPGFRSARPWTASVSSTIRAAAGLRCRRYVALTQHLRNAASPPSPAPPVALTQHLRKPPRPAGQRKSRRVLNPAALIPPRCSF
jgi:hypothetical protein